jgi:hypothetical protein
MLLLQRRHDGHHGLHNPDPLRTLGPKAAFAPQRSMLDGAFGAFFVGSTPG